jgi:DNA-binding beta-propeller fold protein YncE
MLPEAKSEDLLYVTSFVSSYVFVFSYPEGKLVGTLGGFSYAASGECSDNQGDVFIIGVQDVVKYAHGGSNPIATLKSVNYPNGCAIDPVTGNLAVAGGSPHDYEANVLTFARMTTGEISS